MRSTRLTRAISFAAVSKLASNHALKVGQSIALSSATVFGLAGPIVAVRMLSSRPPATFPVDDAHHSPPIGSLKPFTLTLPDRPVAAAVQM